MKVVRDYPVFGRNDHHGHCLIEFTDVRVPLTNLLGEEGGGFANAQARLGPGRIHHVMRALGAGERALQLMVERSKSRTAFGKTLAEQSATRERIAESRVELEAARALCHRAAYAVDSEGNKAARHLIAAAKVMVPRTVVGGHRPRHPDPRRRRHLRRDAAVEALRLAPCDAPLRRPRRGAPRLARPARAHPRADLPAAARSNP